MTATSLASWLVLAVAPVLATAVPAPAPAPPATRDLLRSIGRFTDADWSAVERGASVVRLLDTDSREIALVGAVRIAGSPEGLIARHRDIDQMKRSSIVLDAGRLAVPPAASDFMRVPLEEHSLDLRRCRPGDCPVRLAADDVRRFQREVDWNAPDWRTKSAALWREVLRSYAGAYAAAGRRALPVHVNKEEPLSVASDLSVLVREFAFVSAYSPEFHAYLQEFGPRSPAGAERLLYWTKEDFGIRPILRISDQTVYRVTAPAPVVFVATNQIYADHYLDAALSLTMAIDSADGTGRFDLVAINRARTRSLGGLLRRVARAVAQNRSREGLRKYLVSTKAALEAGR